MCGVGARSFHPPSTISLPHPQSQKATRGVLEEQQQQQQQQHAPAAALRPQAAAPAAEAPSGPSGGAAACGAQPSARGGQPVVRVIHNRCTCTDRHSTHQSCAITAVIIASRQTATTTRGAVDAAPPQLSSCNVQSVTMCIWLGRLPDNVTHTHLLIWVNDVARQDVCNLLVSPRLEEAQQGEQLVRPSGTTRTTQASMRRQHHTVRCWGQLLYVMKEECVCVCVSNRAGNCECETGGRSKHWRESLAKCSGSVHMLLEYAVRLTGCPMF